jgi:transcriptional regulator with XRE-family HTH domain
MPGQGRSTFSTGDPTPFQNWLRHTLEHYDWTQGRLASELGISRAAVARWLAEPGEDTFRRPAYESIRRLADLFGVERSLLLEYAGIADRDDDPALTMLQRETASVVSGLPDAILTVLYPQILALSREEQKDTILSELHSALASPA